MNLVTIVDRLSSAERHVAVGDEYLARQRDLISELERHGHSADQARNLLRALEHTHALHVAHRDRLREQLDAAAEPPRSPLEIEHAAPTGPATTEEALGDYGDSKPGSDLPTVLILTAFASIAVLGVAWMSI